MQFKIIKEGIACVKNDDDNPILYDVQSTLDLIAEAWYTCNYNKLIIQKKDITESFFDLKTGILGEIVQKFVNYNFHVAIVGDFSIYTSKSLKDFIYESNKGNFIFFANSLDEAISALE